MGVRATMNDYLLWGAGAALVVLLLVLQLLRRRARRPVARPERAERGAPHASALTSRSASVLDTVSDVHELNPARYPSGDDARLRAEREAAEQAARAEADREAAEWEARLVAQQLADEERERERIAAERAAAEAVAVPPPAAEPAPEPSSPPSVSPELDEQATLEALAREAAEWEARLAAQQLAEAEAERQRVAADIERVAAEQAAAAEAERAAQERAAQELAAQLAAQQAALIEAERQAQEEAARQQAREVADAQAAEPIAFEFTLDPDFLPPSPPVTSAPLAPAPVAPAPVVARTPEQCLVMIADDSKVVRVKTSRLLSKHLYRVSLAEDGLDAARQIELDLPDVLITDVEMPGMDGFELTRQVRSNPRTAHIPIVMITADDEKHRADALEAGVSVLLSKPYPEDQLLSYLQSTLTGSAAAP